MTYCYEKRSEFSHLLQGDINHICRKALICEVCYGLSIVFLQILLIVHVFSNVARSIILKLSFLLPSYPFWLHICILQRLSEDAISAGTHRHTCLKLGWKAQWPSRCYLAVTCSTTPKGLEKRKPLFSLLWNAQCYLGSPAHRLIITFTNPDHRQTAVDT